MISRTIQHSRFVGLSLCRVFALSGCRLFALSGCRLVGLSLCRVVALSTFRFVALLLCRLSTCRLVGCRLVGATKRQHDKSTTRENRATSRGKGATKRSCEISPFRPVFSSCWVVALSLCRLFAATSRQTLPFWRLVGLSLCRFVGLSGRKVEKSCLRMSGT